MHKRGRKLFTVLIVVIFLGLVGFLSFYQIVIKKQSVFSGTNLFLCSSISKNDKLPVGTLPGIPYYTIEVHEVNRTRSISGGSKEVYPRGGTDFILVDATLYARDGSLSIDAGSLELKDVKHDRKCRVYNLGDRRLSELEEDIASGVIEVENGSKKRAVFVFEVPHEFEPGSIGVGWLNFSLETED